MFGKQCSIVRHCLIFRLFVAEFRNTVNFCIIVLYSVNLLNLFISSNSFLVDSSWLSLCKIMSSSDRDSFMSFFPFWMLCIFFFFSLIVLARTSSTLMNRSGKDGCPCLVLDLRGKASSVPPLFNHEGMIYFVNVFLVFIEMIMVSLFGFFVFCFCIVIVYYSSWFLGINFWENSTSRAWCVIIFIYMYISLYIYNYIYKFLFLFICLFISLLVFCWGLSYLYLHEIFVYNFLLLFLAAFGIRAILTSEMSWKVMSCHFWEYGPLTLTRRHGEPCLFGGTYLEWSCFLSEPGKVASNRSRFKCHRLLFLWTVSRFSWINMSSSALCP